MNGSLNKGLLVAALVLLTACVDGDGTTGVGVPRSVTIAAVPRFAVVPSAAVIDALDRARLTITNTPTDSVITVREIPINPADPEWTFELTLDLPSDQTLALRLEIELIDAGPVVEVVEFAGRTDFEVKASLEPREIREINLGRGPLANLAITALSVTGARSAIQEGGSAVLGVDTVGAAPGQIIFFESTNPTIASVDSVGNVAALVPGTTEIVVSGGRRSVRMPLRVGQVMLPSSAELQARVAPQVDYVTGTTFLASLADAAAALGIREAIENLIGEMLAGRGFQAVGRFEDAEALWEGYGAGDELRFLDGPQLGVLAITLMYAADALGIEFPR